MVIFIKWFELWNDFPFNLNNFDCFLLKIAEFLHFIQIRGRDLSLSLTLDRAIPYKLCSAMQWERVTVSPYVGNKMFQTLLIYSPLTFHSAADVYTYEKEAHPVEILRFLHIRIDLKQKNNLVLILWWGKSNLRLTRTHDTVSLIIYQKLRKTDHCP